jgi:uncharacterized protein
MIEFRTDALHANLYENHGKPLVVIIGGSRKGIWSRIDPEFLEYLKTNFNVLIPAYFGVEGFPATLSRVPLDKIISGIKSIQERLKLTDDGTMIIGNSKGAEAALLISKYICARAIVACVPSCFVWQGIPAGLGDFLLPKSSWTFDGRELPYIRLKYDFRIIQDIRNKVYRSCYERSLAENKRAGTAIDLSQFKGRLLLLSSDVDTYWPSKEMSEKMVRDFKIDVVHKVLHAEGHYFQENKDAIRETIQFLH